MILDSNMQAAIASGSFHIAWLFHLEAKRRDTGVIEPLSIHTGIDTLTLNMNGTNRSYIGVGSIIDIPQFDFSLGLNPSAKEFRLSILHPEITNAIRAYDSRLAPAEVHLAIFDADMNFAGAAPVIDGWADTIDIVESDTEAYCSVGVVSNVRAGTKTLTYTKSNESQKLRDPTDESFKYAAVTPHVKCVWAAGSGPRNTALYRK